MAYCTLADLLLGQLESRLPPEITTNEYIASASDHIDARLGSMYVTPFVTIGVNSLPSHQVKLIKGINAKRASGQIILAATIATEDTVIHQYGLWLLQEADLELAAIVKGDYMLSAPRVDSEGYPLDPTGDPGDTDPYAHTPSATNIDMYSATAAFEAHVFQGQPAVWTPRDGTRETIIVTPRGH